MRISTGWWRYELRWTEYRPEKSAFHSFDCAGYRDIGTALFAFVRAKKGNGNQRFFGEMFEKLLKFYIEKLLHIFVECDLFFCQARCFQNGGIIAGESSKGRKLGCGAEDG